MLICCRAASLADADLKRMLPQELTLSQGWCCSEDGDYEKEGCVAGDSCLCVGLVCFVSWRSSREKVVCVSKLKFTHNAIPNLL